MWHLPWSRFPQAEDYDPRLKARRRRLLWLLLGAGLVAVAAMRPAWRWWKERLVETGVARAAAHVERQEWRAAQLLLEQNLAARPNDPRVLRGMAQFFDRLGLVEGLVYWRALLEQKPAADSDLIAAATAGLKAGDRALAREALAEATPAAKSGAAWLRPAAALALVEGRLDEARRFFGELHRLDPADERARMHYHVARLDDASAAVRGDARERLGELARAGRLRIVPVLALFLSGQSPAAPENMARIARRIFPAQRFSEEDAVHALVEHMKAQPEPNAEEAVRLVRYLAERERAREARLWLAGVSAEVRSEPLVREAEAGLAADLADWPELKTLLERGAWGGASAKTIEAGFEARALFARGDAAAAMVRWRLALLAAETDPNGAALLVRLAVLWRQPEAGRLAMRVAGGGGRVRNDTLARLAGLAAEAGNTRALAEAVGRWALAEPQNRELADRRLYLAALLGELTAAQKTELAGEPAATDFRLATQGWLALHGPHDRARIEALLAPPLPATAPASARLVRALLQHRAGRTLTAGVQLAALHGEELLPEERARLVAAIAK